MRKTVTTLALALGLVATSANADLKTLEAMQSAGIVLTQEQAASLENASCSATDCSALADQIGEIVAANADNDAAVEAILKAAASVHPDQANQFGDAAIAAAPTAVAVIAGVMSEIAPTAAGGITSGGTQVASGTANPTNIPSPPSGGGSSSPN